jgi:hypothetical protein
MKISIQLAVGTAMVIFNCSPLLISMINRLLGWNDTIINKIRIAHSVIMAKLSGDFGKSVVSM